MKFFVSLIVILLLFLSCPATIQSKEKNAPLPPRVLSAVTVYVDNQTGSGELQNVAYTELCKWARLRIVTSPKKADIILILRLSSGNSVRYASAGERSGSRAHPPTYVKQNWIDADVSVPKGSTRISVLDPKTGNSLWSDIRKTDNIKAASHMLDGLRAAFDEKR